MGRFETGFFSLESGGLRPPQGKVPRYFPLWGYREIQNPVLNRSPVGHLGPQLSELLYILGAGQERAGAVASGVMAGEAGAIVPTSDSELTG